MRQPPQRNVGRRAGETFGAGQLDGRHPQSFDVAGVTNRAHGNAIVNLEEFLSRLAQRNKQDAIAITERGDRAARGELRLNVFAPVRDRFDPAIRLLDHATVSWKMLATFCSGRVAMPSRETTLISG